MHIRGFATVRKFIPAVIAATVLCTPVFASEISDVSTSLRAKQYAAALAKADEYLASRPDDPQMRFLKGLALTGMDRREEAISYFTKLSSDYPSMPEPYNNLAVLYAAGGQYDKARAALERAVQANPSYARAHENLADTYAQLASQSYAAMLKLEPDNANVRAKQALILSAINYRAGRTPAAPAQSAQAPITTPAAPARWEQAPTTAAASARRAQAPTTAAAPGQEAEVVAAIDEWAQAWSARDVADYLDFYSPDFRTPHHMSRAHWEAKRRARLKEASFIDVEIQSPEVSIDGTKATTTFYQSYRSDRSSSRDRKTLIWEKQDGKWKIVREDSRK